MLIGIDASRTITGERTGTEAYATFLLQALIPQAIAQSFRDGNLGIMDYYRLRNLQADTDMRKSLGDQTKPSNSGD